MINLVNDKLMMYYKITSDRENHYKDGLNIFEGPFIETASCIENGFNFTDINHIVVFLRKMIYSDKTFSILCEMYLEELYCPKMMMILG